uniref:Uncharacterized protein n=1 Tax=Eikenella corrodens TaxID=539 RepID=A0A1A9RJJ1_EIKCO|nr:hypothetical protein A7P90_06555 [Eikenella corrodens]
MNRKLFTFIVMLDSLYGGILILSIIYAIFIVVGNIYLNRLGFQTLQEIVESLTTPTTYNFIFIVIPVMSLFVALIDYRVASTAWIEYL